MSKPASRPPRRPASAKHAGLVACGAVSVAANARWPQASSKPPAGCSAAGRRRAT